jgi:oxygen-independent coproporphyrinogen-3 oxidase
VQDFDEQVQAAINRPQSYEATAAALRLLREAGIKRSNIDLVYGLPRQTLDTLGRTLDQAIALAPDRFAVFAYAHVPWMKPHQKLIDAATLPDGPTRAAMARLVAEKLTQADYVSIGLDHYACAGDALARASSTGALRRTFQGYVADITPWVIGIGASAISSLPAGYSQNVVDVAAYMQALAAGRFATARGAALTEDDRLRSDLIGRLMCRYEADVDEVCKRHHTRTDTFLASLDRLAPMQQDGLVAFEGNRLKVTERGRPLLRAVCAAFDRYYTGGEGRHSRI